MTLDLDGTAVLVTRPDPRATELCRLIESRGGTAFHFPVLHIDGQTLTATITEKIACAGPDDLAIFVSRSAVEHGAHLLLEHATSGRPRVAAIGHSTAAALETAGLSVDVVPKTGHNSEALLAETSLHGVSDRTVVIFRGTGGREMLAETLRQRGATVHYAEVYERKATAPSRDEVLAIETAWRAGGIHLVVALSVETLMNLEKLLSPEGQELLRQTPLVTASTRVVSKAVSLGMTAPHRIAKNPDNEGILAALCV